MSSYGKNNSLKARLSQPNRKAIYNNIDWIRKINRMLQDR